MLVLALLVHTVILEKRLCWIVGVISLTLVMCRRGTQAAPVIVFDYTYDSEGFFDPVIHPERREILELAADSINRFIDILSPIDPPDFSHTWHASFARPDGLGNGSIHGPLNEDEIRIFVGTKNMGSGPAYPFAEANSQGVVETTPPGDKQWEDAVKYRGQAGAAAMTDYGCWGGTISFNSNSDKNWYFGATSAGLALDNEVTDFLTIATHEIGHILGMGQAPSFDALIKNGKFTGSASLVDIAIHGNSSEIFLDGNAAHWAQSMTSFVGESEQTPLMAPDFSRDERRRMTTLDFAGLEDIGWELALAGDVDRDRDVDTDDLLQILAANSFNRGKGFGWSSGDNDADGDVDTRDILNILAALQGEFPKSYASETEMAPDVIVNRTAGLFDGSDNLGDSLIGEFATEFDILGDLSVNYLTANGTQLQTGNVVIVPEPSALVMLSLGVLVLGSLQARRLLRR